MARRAGAAVGLGVVTLALAAACVVAPEPPPRHGAYEDVRRVVAVLDEVAGEYPRAVRDGAVIDASRMRVVDTLLHDAQLFGARFPDDERAALREVDVTIAARAAPAQVVALARALRRRVMASHQFVLAPSFAPDRQRARQLWDMLCAGCHGIDGLGDGPQGLSLDPEPKDFHEWAFISELAPSRAFSQISDGVRGTAMPQWGLFTTSERWGLAFLAFTFRFDPAAVARGRTVTTALGLPTSLSALADRTEIDLLADLRSRGLDEERAGDALAFLRAEAVFSPPTGRLAEVRVALASLALAYPQRGPEIWDAFARARAGLERVDDAIRAATPTTADRLERRMVRLEAAIAAGALDEVIDREVVGLGPLLDRAELALHAPDPRGTIRIALEWTLVPAIALGLLLGRRRAPRRRGWILAVGLVGIGSLVLGALGGRLLPGVLSLGLVGILAASLALTRARDRGLPELVVAALIGGPLGRLAWTLLDVFGGPGLLGVLLAVLSLGAAIVGVRALASRIPHGGALALATLVLVGASAAGRGAWWVVERPTIPLWRIEALGVFPSVPALAAAAAGAIAVLVAARRASRRDP